MARRKTTPITDSIGYLSFMERVTRNFAKRAKDDGIDALHSLALINKLHEGVMGELVQYLRSEEGGAHSWAEIGEALGITRQSAQARFGGEGARVPGGQPAHLR
jgi:hypothetical protein